MVGHENKYWTFGKDALHLKEILNVKLVKYRLINYKCFVPRTAIDTVMQNVIKAGYKVALCDPL